MADIRDDYERWLHEVYEYEMALGQISWWRRLLGERPSPQPSPYPPIEPGHSDGPEGGSRAE